MALIDQIRALYKARASSEEFELLAEKVPAGTWNAANRRVREELGRAPRLFHRQKVAVARLGALRSWTAMVQAERFISAIETDDPDWRRTASSPELVAALGGQTADQYLGW